MWIDFFNPHSLLLYHHFGWFNWICQLRKICLGSRKRNYDNRGKSDKKPSLNYWVDYAIILRIYLKNVSKTFTILSFSHLKYRNGTKRNETKFSRTFYIFSFRYSYQHKHTFNVYRLRNREYKIQRLKPLAMPILWTFTVDIMPSQHRERDPRDTYRTLYILHTRYVNNFRWKKKLTESKFLHFNGIFQFYIHLSLAYLPEMAQNESNSPILRPNSPKSTILKRSNVVNCGHMSTK